jgi:large subunit ribosomal protein L22
MTEEEKNSPEEETTEAAAEEAPKPRRTRRKKADAEEQPAAEASEAEATEAEETPKPRRTRRKKADEAEEAQVEAAEDEVETPVAADAEGEPQEDDEAEGEEEAEAEGEEEAEAKPRRGRRRSSETAAPDTPAQPVHRTAPARRLDDGTVVVRAQAKYVRCAPRKARLVVDHIRGKSVGDARAILTHTPRAAARDVLKLLESAVANAENNHELDADDLVVRKVYVDEGPTLKRYRPRALGRATRIRKRTSHMTIQLSPKE